IFRRAMHLRASLRDVTVIGITGSAGKTTTKELLAHVLEQRSPLTTPAHVNTEMGVAQWLIQELKKAESQESPSVLIVEMGAYQMGEIALLCSIVQPTMGVVTYVGSQHIALFGSQEALCKAKGELVEALPVTGHAFLNADNERCSSLAARARCPVTTVGTGGRADIEAFEVEETEHGIRFRVKETAYDIPIHGTHNVTNVLLAIAVAQSLGMAPQEIARRLQTFKPPAHTFDMRTERGITILDDTHNASPASFEAAMQWARAQPAEQRVLLTSGLIELGEEQDRIHIELGTMAASVFDRVIFLSGQSAKPFRRGFGREVELLSNRTPPVPPSSLLVCIGRMNEETMRRLLPLNS
ncbi:MAG: UDP-N-acetylmuramoyl-tripeptide--D-alanyl-D-alanine ligase, partial [Candidatus Peribacteraceae bacterium]|nr:UDP-N-acetylmuramoyl-tripeptide--D-alanyl-D-alanine ligase [Candidatus Peribacteraceae bacterium]